MPTSIRIAPPYSLLFISDQDGGKTPEITRGGPRIWSTASCIAVGCLAFMDGETEVTLGVATDVDPGVQPTFDGLLETPRQAVIISTVEHKNILQAIVLTKRTRVRIWTNHPSEPDKVQIGLG